MGKEDGCVTWAPRRGPGSAGPRLLRVEIFCNVLYWTVLVCFWFVFWIQFSDTIWSARTGLLPVIVSCSICDSSLMFVAEFLFFQIKNPIPVFPKQNSNTKCSSSNRLRQYTTLDVHWCELRKNPVLADAGNWLKDSASELQDVDAKNCGKQPRSIPSHDWQMFGQENLFCAWDDS